MQRPYDEVKQSFERVASVLDAALEAARPQLAAQAIEIHDHSNRSCFDKSGFPYCRWSFWFDKTYPHGSEIGLASARIEYFEPIGDDSEPRLRAEFIAEIYQPGQQSRVEERTVQHFALDEVGLHVLVMRLIGVATARLMQHGVVVAM